MPTPGQRWKAAREASGLSVLDAAALAGVHRNTIYDMEKDDDGVTLRLMKRLAPVYGTTLGEIFRDEGGPDRLPSEFRPLLEPLLPLTQEQRENVIRNIATNLMFMRGQTVTSGREIVAVIPSVLPYNPGPQSNSTTDDPDAPLFVGTQPRRSEGGTSGRTGSSTAGRSPKRKGGAK